ncbi:1,4-alpha-glucan branching enzyme, partial [Pseudomonas syringae pv. tagetis]
VHARPADAFAWLGPHQQPDGQRQLRVLVPHAHRVEVIAGPERRWSLQPGPLPGLFEGPAGEAPVPLLALHFEQGVEQVHDAYSFGPLLDEA